MPMTNRSCRLRAAFLAAATAFAAILAPGLLGFGGVAAAQGKSVEVPAARQLGAT